MRYNDALPVLVGHAQARGEAEAVLDDLLGHLPADHRMLGEHGLEVNWLPDDRDLVLVASRSTRIQVSQKVDRQPGASGMKVNPGKCPSRSR